MGFPVSRLFVSLAASTLVVDQATKVAATTWLLPRGSVQVIPGFFDLSYVLNRGAVFGIFRGLQDPYRGLLLTIVPIIALVVVLAMVMRTPTDRLRTHAALGLILGGALGNLLDRLRLGAVVDFLEFYVGQYHWPNFNAADSAICIGVTLLVIDIWRTTPDR